MKEKKKRDWGKLAAVLCAVLLAVNLWQLREISDLQEELRSTETNLQMETRRLDERVQAVQRTVRDADKLVQDWELRSVDVDPASKCLRAEVSLRLKEWREDTQVCLAIMQGPDTRYAALTSGGGQYTGVAEFPANSQEVRLVAQISAEGFRKEEDLFGWDSASMLLPVQCCGWSVGGPDYARNPDKTGTLTVTSCGAELEGFEGNSLPQLSGQVFRLRPGLPPPAERGDRRGKDGHVRGDHQPVHLWGTVLGGSNRRRVHSDLLLPGRKRPWL